MIYSGMPISAHVSSQDAHGLPVGRLALENHLPSETLTTSAASDEVELWNWSNSRPLQCTVVFLAQRLYGGVVMMQAGDTGLLHLLLRKVFELDARVDDLQRRVTSSWL